MSGEDFVYDETTGEWVSAADAAANAKAATRYSDDFIYIDLSATVSTL